MPPGWLMRRYLADIDERAVETGLAGAPPAEVAEALAVAKAAAVAATHPGALVLGSDSLVVAGGTAVRQAALGGGSGRTPAVLLRHRDGTATARRRWCETGGANGAMPASPACTYATCPMISFAEYLDREWPAISHTVGAFRIEGPGVQLFDSIEGDQFTVLGMPLLPLLGALREAGALLA